MNRRGAALSRMFVYSNSFGREVRTSLDELPKSEDEMGDAENREKLTDVLPGNCIVRSRRVVYIKTRIRRCHWRRRILQKIPCKTNEGEMGMGIRCSEIFVRFRKKLVEVFCVFDNFINEL